MQNILKELRDADAKGICPPQNWTTRAADKIESLQAALSAAEEENKRLREALDRIATYDLSGLSDIRDAAAVLQKIAREAVS